MDNNLVTMADHLKVFSHVFSDLSEYVLDYSEEMDINIKSFRFDLEECRDKVSSFDDQSVEFRKLSDDIVELKSHIANYETAKIYINRINSYLARHLDDIVAEIVLLKQ